MSYAQERRPWRVIPRGQTLPAAEWEHRHRLLVWVLWAHALVLTAVSMLTHGMGMHAAEHVVILIPLALVAGQRRGGRRVRQIATTFGLLNSSAVIVHMSGGLPEAHFHYFSSIVLLSLYEDWMPFLIAISYVLVEHGVIGVTQSSTLAHHPTDPWFSAGIHAVAVALTGAATALMWRLNEDVRQTEAKVRDRLAHGALHDELTGLPNRRLLVEELERSYARYADGDCGAAVLFVNIDHFKLINDSVGHGVGDRILVEIAARLRSSVGQTDLVARSGGDEFVVIARPAGCDEDALAAATRIFDALRAPFEIGGGARRVSVSIGLSRFHPCDLSSADALARADVAMHRAKADGRGRSQLADDEVLQAARRRIEIETALQQSSREQFELHYQPIVDLADGSIAAVEALLRWEHPSLGPVSPAEFIPIAESSGSILEIGRWALELAVGDAVRWEALRGRPIKVFVNVAASQITHPGFAETLAEVLADAGAIGRHLALELTETSLVEGAIPAATLAALETAGIDLAIDDFGTGFSSLGYLARFPVSMIKLDRSFVAACSDDPASSVILDAVAHLARGLGLPALAEGIETAAQLEEVRARGFQLGQGYLLARPKRPRELDAVLGSRRPYAALLGSTVAVRLAA
jgi:diguanylate cyclase (GGDEF)-like protein